MEQSASQPSFNARSHVAVIPNHKIVLLLLHNCNIAAVLNRDVDI